MEKYSLYICDLDERFVSMVRSVVSESTAIDVVGNSDNGRQGLGEILRLKPDVVLTDIPLPGLDGIALLRQTRRFVQPPAVIICTRFYSDAIMRQASRYGAAYFLCKPIELQTLPGLIAECGGCRAESSVRHPEVDEIDEVQRRRAGIALSLLKELGLSPRLYGSAYILEAALHCHDDATLFKNLTQGLYAVLAGRMDTTPSRIERSLRNAIDIAYERGTLSRHFPHKPTNKEFLEHIMRAIDEAERDRT